VYTTYIYNICKYVVKKVHDGGRFLIVSIYIIYRDRERYRYM